MKKKDCKNELHFERGQNRFEIVEATTVNFFLSQKALRTNFQSIFCQMKIFHYFRLQKKQKLKQFSLYLFHNFLFAENHLN
jgi:hypothetical protein